MPSFHRRMSCHGTSSSPSMNRSDRTLIGSPYSRNRSTSPRPAKPSISSPAEGRDHAQRALLDIAWAERRLHDARMRSWSGPSIPSMFTPIVRFSVEGSVAPVKVIGSMSTALTSSKRVTSHSPTAGTQLTGSSSRRRA